METTLHRQLKAIYAGAEGQIEATVDSYRIDAIVAGELIEIQRASLAAIRKKAIALAEHHTLRIVKPIIASRVLVNVDRKGKIISRRRSPKRGTMLDLFEDLVYFARVFPRSGLTLEAVLVDIEETRKAPTKNAPVARRRRRRPAALDQKLVSIVDRVVLQSADHLLQLMPADLPSPFHTGDLAAGLGIPRWQAQRVAYCLRHCGAVAEVGKRRNSFLYEYADPTPAAKRAA